MQVRELAIISKSRRLAHPDACRIYHEALSAAAGQTVVIDLSRVEEATTSAFARLVLLRRELRRRGGDLRLRGLRDGAARLYELNRLDSVLPRV